MSSPTDTSKQSEIAKLNEEQKSTISKLQAEVEQLRLQQENLVRADSTPTITPGQPGVPDNTGHQPQATLKDSESEEQLSDNDDATGSDASGKTA
jgi:hypothetical protein